MPFPSDIKYPAAATNAAWQKKKSLTDKGIKTKVGPALVTAEAKWKLIKFDDLDDRNPSKTAGGAENALNKAKAAWPALGDARDALGAALKVAQTQAANKKLSSASRTALTKIATSLKEADRRLELMDEVMQSFQIDYNTTLKEAMATLSNLEVKQGSKTLAHAKTAKLQSNKSYLVTNITWRTPIKMSLDLLQKKVDVSFHDGSGRLVKKQMTITGLTGDTEMRLKE